MRLILLCLCASVAMRAQSDFLHVDQFGYFPNATKVAVVSDPQTGYNAAQSFTPATLEVRNASNDVVVYSGTPLVWNSGNTHADSGDRGWWFDFSSVTVPGTYYISTQDNSQQTDEFEIGNNVYRSVTKDAARMFYYNRCNATKATPYAESPWTDGDNFAQDATARYYLTPNDASSERDLTGGWFDAGDYNKYVTFAEEVVHDLLWTYEETPNALSDNWNIPESGNGIPDLVDEVKYEIDWLQKMVNNDGSVIIKMGSVDYSHNAASPPSANSDPRYYGPTCTSSSIAAAGMLAHAALVYQDFPALQGEVAGLTTMAENCFAYFTSAATLETNCDDGTIKAGDADRTVVEQRQSALLAAVHLWELTGKAVYHNYLINNINDASPINSGWWGPYTMSLNTALLHYTTLPGNNAALETQIINSASGSANGTDFTGFSNNTGLYRSSMPDWAYHWGSNRPKANFGNLNMLFARYNLNGAASDFEQKGLEILHYFHGVNPLDMVMLSNMNNRGAGRSVDEIYHTWFYDGTDYDNVQTSLYGPAPGFVTGGPNKDFTVTTISPPANQPPMKSYLDFNSGWPDNSWEITEPAIYYQSSYLRLLAAQQENIVLPVSYARSLYGQAEMEGVRLYWSTTLEVNADRFEVQREAENGSWQTLGTVAAKGAGAYQFLDSDPNVGLNYYRLRQVDLDGTSEISPRVSVNFRGFGPPVIVAPNPVDSGSVRLRGLSRGADLSIFDASGRRVTSFRDVRTEMRIETSDWRPGYYAFVLTNGNGVVIWRDLILKR